MKTCAHAHALALGLAATLACLPAAAAPLSGVTQITARAATGALFSAADGYAAATNPASAAISDAFGDVEFLSDDGNLFFDFKSDGSFDLYGLANGLSNSVEFDFAGLGGRFFTAAFASTVDGLRLDIVDADTLRLTLDGVQFAADGSPYSARLTVPEPTGLALAALAALLAVRRRASR